MHNQDFTLQLLVNLALHYPQAGRTPAQLQILAEDWAEDLAEFSPETVERAVKQYRRECAYFPTVAYIWARCDELRRGEAARADALALLLTGQRPAGQRQRIGPRRFSPPQFVATRPDVGYGGEVGALAP